MDAWTQFNPSLNVAVCEAINVPMCRYMPFNLTRMPNMLQHASQDIARRHIDQFEILVHTKCDAHLLFFLCSMFVPICMSGFQELQPIPPCRHVCEASRKGCEPLLNRFHLAWPFDCHELPRYERGVCTSPESFVVNDMYVENTCQVASGMKRRFHDCKCKNPPSLKQKTFKRLKFDYAIRAKVMSVETAGHVTVANVSIIRIFKHGMMRLSKGSVIALWTICSCTCPKLQINQNYIIMGHEDVFNHRLQYNNASIAKRWKSSYSDIVKKWVLAEKNGKIQKRARSKRHLRDITTVQSRTRYQNSTGQQVVFLTDKKINLTILSSYN